tara:strand:+ start:52 stop:201 length:150 start_codon:yes stop_codon:yes gene_type:complete
MGKMRNRFNKGKKVRGVNKHTGELGLWRKTQVERTLSAKVFRQMREEEE